MCIRIVFIGLLLFINFKIAAQSNWEKGYVIYNNGDTVKGFVKIPFLGIHKNEVYFAENQSRKKKYKTNDLKGFGQYDNKHFVRGDHFNKKLQFEESLISGRYQLLKEGTNFALLKNDSVYTINTNRKRKLVSKYNRNFLIDVNRSRGVLNYFFRDCRQDISKIYLNEAGITKAFIDYLNCKNIPFQYSKANLPHVKFNFKVGVGFDVISLNTAYNFIHSFDAELAPSISIEFHNFYPRITNNFFFTGGLIFSNVKIQDADYIQNGNPDGGIYDRSIEYQSFRIPFGLGFQQKFRKITTYVKLGSGLFLSNNTKISEVLEIQQFNTIYLLEDYVKADNTYRALFWGSIGTEYKYNDKLKFFAELRHDAIAQAIIINPLETRNNGIRGFQSSGLHVGLTF